MTLEAANLLYRCPELYDAVNATPDIDTVVQLAATWFRGEPSSLLDIGCGTGTLLVSLPANYTRRVGIDFQVGMVRYARNIHPDLDARIGDVRSLRTGQTFDVITCVGLVFAYLRTDDELRAAISSVTAHAHDGTVFVLQTLTRPIFDTKPTHCRMTLLGRDVEVRTSYEWAPPNLVMHRHWTFADGEIATDVLSRRVWPVESLEVALNETGFVLVDEVNGYRVATFHST